VTELHQSNHLTVGQVCYLYNGIYRFLEQALERCYPRYDTGVVASGITLFQIEWFHKYVESRFPEALRRITDLLITRFNNNTFEFGQDYHNDILRLFIDDRG